MNKLKNKYGKVNQVTKGFLMIAIILTIISILGCSSKNNNKTNNNSIDNTKLSIIDKVLAKKPPVYEDFEAVFSGTNPVAFTVLDDFNATHSPLNKIRMLSIEKLYHKAEEMYNAKLDTKTAEKNAENMANWPIFRINSETYIKWHNGLKQVHKK